MRPDRIAHKRKSGDKNNFIIIEAKKKYIDKKDKHKIENLVNNEKFKYLSGVGAAYFLHPLLHKTRQMVAQNVISTSGRNLKPLREQIFRIVYSFVSLRTGSEPKE